MRSRNKRILWVIWNVSAFLSFLLAVNYAAGVYWKAHNPFPYGLSLQARCFVLAGEMREGLESLRSLGDSLAAVLEKKNGEGIGIYDPGMIYPSRSIARVETGVSRYFSEEDYESGRKVMVYLNGEGEAGKEKWAPAAWNLYTLEPEEGDLLYVDSNSQKTLERAAELLANYGYEEIKLEKQPEASLGEIVSWSWTDRYSFCLLAAAGSVLLLCPAAFYCAAGKSRSGQTEERRSVLAYFLIQSGACLLAGAAGWLYSGCWYLSAGNFLAVWSIELLASGLVSLLAGRKKRQSSSEKFWMVFLAAASVCSILFIFVFGTWSAFWRKPAEQRKVKNVYSLVPVSADMSGSRELADRFQEWIEGKGMAWFWSEELWEKTGKNTLVVTGDLKLFWSGQEAEDQRYENLPCFRLIREPDGCRWIGETDQFQILYAGEEKISRWLSPENGEAVQELIERAVLYEDAAVYEEELAELLEGSFLDMGRD